MTSLATPSVLYRWLPCVQSERGERVVTHQGRTWVAYLQERWGLGAGWHLVDDAGQVTTEGSWDDVASRIRGAP